MRGGHEESGCAFAISINKGPCTGNTPKAKIKLYLNTKSISKALPEFLVMSDRRCHRVWP